MDLGTRQTLNTLAREAQRTQRETERARREIARAVALCQQAETIAAGMRLYRTMRQTLDHMRDSARRRELAMRTASRGGRFPGGR